MLEDLMARAGASDTDREAWLAERAQGVTATEIRDLAKCGAGFRLDLIAQKRGAPSTFTGNQYTAWRSRRCEGCCCG